MNVERYLYWQDEPRRRGLTRAFANAARLSAFGIALPGSGHLFRPHRSCPAKLSRIAETDYARALPRHGDSLWTGRPRALRGTGRDIPLSLRDHHGNPPSGPPLRGAQAGEEPRLHLRRRAHA